MAQTSKKQTVPANNTTERTKTPPVAFANTEALFDSLPSLLGNPFYEIERTEAGPCPLQVHYDAGHHQIMSLASTLMTHPDPSLDIEDRYNGMVGATVLNKGAAILLDRIIGAMCGSYSYTLAYQRDSESRFQAVETKLLNVDGGADREFIAGLISQHQRLEVDRDMRAIQAARLCRMIEGACDAYTEATGQTYALYVPGPKLAGSIGDALAEARAKIAARTAAK